MNIGTGGTARRFRCLCLRGRKEGYVFSNVSVIIIYKRKSYALEAEIRKKLGAIGYEI